MFKWNNFYNIGTDWDLGNCSLLTTLFHTDGSSCFILITMTLTTLLSWPPCQRTQVKKFQPDKYDSSDADNHVVTACCSRVMSEAPSHYRYAVWLTHIRNSVYRWDNAPTPSCLLLYASASGTNEFRRYQQRERPRKYLKHCSRTKAPPARDELLFTVLTYSRASPSASVSYTVLYICFLSCE